MPTPGVYFLANPIAALEIKYFHQSQTPIRSGWHESETLNGPDQRFPNIALFVLKLDHNAL